MFDVVIIGAGPAGLHAARRLAERHVAVVVLEEHQTVGEPVHCTGILAREAFAEFDLSRASILNELTTARFVSPFGQQFSHQTHQVEAVVVDRAAFDAGLADAATRAGATIVRGARATALRRVADGVEVTVAGQATVAARACVLACGGRYGLHRTLGLGLPSLYLHTAQREVPASRPGDVEVHFGRGIAPHGFAWAVPVWRDGRPHARIGVMAEGEAPRYFGRMLDRVAARWGIDAAAVPTPRQKILPLARIDRTYDERLIVVGDAAGLVKPTTGGGIYYSLLSATIAAEVLAEALTGEDLSAARLAEYERRWHDRLASELDTQLSFRQLVQGMPDHDIEGLFDLALTDGVLPIVKRTASFNRHRKLIVALLKHPPARQLLFRSLVS
jgi:geranylgeranyl reductase family protein